MVMITPSNTFKKNIKRLNEFDRDKLEKQIKKIIANPNVGKPLKYKRGERSLYIKPFRLIYAVRGDEIILLKFGHRKDIYDN
ncbi:MAG: type II toxin-antitoxin system RelE/ParE family toxin [Nanoarchaeota archaeon]|nr:type II toxin-antitoxin system RelE/ParE family toxin [Nanoarchaeota archaeon]